MIEKIFHANTGDSFLAALNESYQRLRINPGLKKVFVINKLTGNVNICRQPHKPAL